MHIYYDTIDILCVSFDVSVVQSVFAACLIRVTNPNHQFPLHFRLF